MTKSNRDQAVADPKWVEQLIQTMDNPRQEVRQRVRDVMSGDKFDNPPRETTDEYRESIWELLKIIADDGIAKIGIDKELGGEGDPNAFMTAFETISEGDISLLIKFGVQFGLFGGSIQNLGTEHHHKTYLADAMTAKLAGCFAMTEGNHGSNVAGLETTITYQKKSDSYIINTPNEEAGKDYIGNAAVHAKMASVFGQLIVDGESHGVHCILVPVRDDDGKAMPGVRIEDDGHKMGLNGVDNGRFWFDKVKVPRKNLLNRFGGVNKKGKYESSIESESRRFFTMLGTLVGGRVSIGIGGLTAAKRALRIAIDHGSQRRQFGEEGKPETILMDYKLHQMRLIPRLVKTYAYHFALRDLIERYGKATDVNEGRLYEREAAALKAIATWHATDTIQACREACGGAGYISKMGFTDLKGDTDIFATFEGDNTVLQLLVARETLKDFGQKIKKSGPIAAALEFALGQCTRYQLSVRLLFSKSEISSLKLYNLLLERERILMFDAGKRIRKRIKTQGMTPTMAFNKEGPLLTHLANAYTDFLVFNRFREALSVINDQTLRQKLEDLLILFGMLQVAENKNWYLTKGLIPLSLCKDLDNMIEDKVEGLRDDAQGFAKGLTSYL